MRNAYIGGALLAVSISLAGCGSTGTLGPSNVITQDGLDATRAAYDGAFLAPARNYRYLGYCATGTVATLTKPCADRAVVAKLQAADAAIEADFDTVQSDIDSGNTTGSAADFSLLQAAITTAEKLAATLGVH